MSASNEDPLFKKLPPPSFPPPQGHTTKRSSSLPHESDENAKKLPSLNLISAELSSDPNVISLKDLAIKCQGVSTDQFIAHNPGPFLIQQSFITQSGSDAGFFTAVGTVNSPQQSVDPRDSAVFFVRKKSDALFTHMITVGRSANNDIVINHPRVSKFHAYFTTKESKDDWHITDTGSTNGTYFGDTKLEAKVAHRLNEQDLSFGEALSFRFIDNHQLFQFIQYIQHQLNK
ncbi:MAG: FHA domain-containing protein [Planctomycetota bacterium]|nr:FHA domain-containing protein [Planctomycetota bacterium]